MALELAENIAEVYATAEDATKRSISQAFFRKLYVMPEWDADDERAARIERAELTEPYTAPLADGLVEGVMAEIETLTAQAATNENRFVEPISQPDKAVSYFDQMVPLPGFEPGFPP